MQAHRVTIFGLAILSAMVAISWQTSSRAFPSLGGAAAITAGTLVLGGVYYDFVRVRRHVLSSALVMITCWSSFKLASALAFAVLAAASAMACEEGPYGGEVDPCDPSIDELMAKITNATDVDVFLRISSIILPAIGLVVLAYRGAQSSFCNHSGER